MVKKTIIFSSYDDLRNPYYAGGGARAIFEVAKRLSGTFSVTIITGNYPGAQNIAIGNIRYKRIGPAILGPKIGQLLFHFLLPFAVKKEQFDLWIESFTPPFSVSSLQRYTKKPVIGLAHMLSAEDMERKYKLPFHIIEQHGLKQYNYFITMTKETKEKIRQHNKKATFYIIPNGVEMVKTNQRKISRQNYILFLGRIEVNQKGVDLLLEAFEKIKNKTQTKLVVAGSGTQKEEAILQKLIIDKQLEKHVLVTGRVAGKKKEQLLSQALFTVIPSRFETFGNVVLESMAYSKPIIGFAINGLQWVPADCMIKVKPFDTNELAKSMEKLITDKSLYTKMQRATKQTVKAYSWDKTALAYKQVIYTII